MVLGSFSVGYLVWNIPHAGECLATMELERVGRANGFSRFGWIHRCISGVFTCERMDALQYFHLNSLSGLVSTRCYSIVFPLYEHIEFMILPVGLLLAEV
jgi:hypothetical protein